MGEKKSDNKVRCACGSVKGKLLEVAGRGELLVVNDTCTDSFHGICLKCGREYHYSISEEKLKRLLERMGYNMKTDWPQYNPPAPPAPMPTNPIKPNQERHTK